MSYFFDIPTKTLSSLFYQNATPTQWLLLGSPMLMEPHPNGFYWDHQYSWTLTSANSMQDSIMQSDDRNPFLFAL